MMFEKILSETPNLKEEFESYGLFENDVQLIKDLMYAPIFKSRDVDPKMTYSEKV